MDGNPGGREQGKNLNYLRASNLGAVIQHLLAEGGISRLQLAKRLGLTKMSITYLVNGLIEQGIVREEATDGSGGPGRRPIGLFLCPGSLYAVGVYISRNHVHASLTDLLGNVELTLRDRLTGGLTPELLAALLTRLIRELLEQGRPLRILGIGVASIGLVSRNSGTVHFPPDFLGGGEFPVGETLHRAFGLPVYVQNDMRAAALAEQYYGRAKGFSDFVYLGITNGIGAGAVIQGRLLEGNGGFAGELGHLCIRREGARCGCGNRGCLELYASIPRLLERSGAPDWEAFLRRAERADSREHGVLEEFTEDMGAALCSIANTFDPQAILLGHEGAMLPDWCLERLQGGLDASALARGLKQIRVLPSMLSRKTLQQSAAAVIYYSLFRGAIGL